MDGGVVNGSGVRFAKGDVVRKKSSGAVDVVKAVPGDPEYDSKRFLSADRGFLLEHSGWSFQEKWEFDFTIKAN